MAEESPPPDETGRPRRSRKAKQSVRLDDGLLAEIEAFQERERISFSAAMRIVLQVGMQILKQPPAVTAPRRRVLSRGVPY